MVCEFISSANIHWATRAQPLQSSAVSCLLWWIFSSNKSEGRVVPLRCPQGWTMFRSSCYQISATTNTWDHAQRDCEQKGAHLVIFNDQEEEVFVFLSPLFNHLTACVPSANHEKHLSPHRVFSIFLTLLLKCGSVWALKTPVGARQHGRGWMEPDLPLSKTCQTFVSRSSVTSRYSEPSWCRQN